MPLDHNEVALVRGAARILRGYAAELRESSTLRDGVWPDCEAATKAEYIEIVRHAEALEGIGRRHEA